MVAHFHGVFFLQILQTHVFELRRSCMLLHNFNFLVVRRVLSICQFDIEDKVKAHKVIIITVRPFNGKESSFKEYVTVSRWLALAEFFWK